MEDIGIDREVQIQLEIECLQNELKKIQENRREIKPITKFSSEEKVKGFNKVHQICEEVAVNNFINKEIDIDSEIDAFRQIMRICLGEDITSKIEVVVYEE